MGYVFLLAIALVIVMRSTSAAERRQYLLKVLKAVAEYHDLTLGDLLEGIVLHAFEGKCAFERGSLERIGQLNMSPDLLNSLLAGSGAPAPSARKPG